MDDYSDALALAPEGVRLPAFAQTPEQMAAGRRAAMDLTLQDLKTDLQRMVNEKNRLLAQSDVYRAFSLGIDIENKRAEVEALQAELERAALAAPVVLTHDQCAAVDETIGAVA
jgi:hypothetical protein